MRDDKRRIALDRVLVERERLASSPVEDKARVFVTSVKVACEICGTEYWTSQGVSNIGLCNACTKALGGASQARVLLEQFPTPQRGGPDPLPQIVSLLRKRGPLSLAEVSESLGMPPALVKLRLRFLQKRHAVVPLAGQPRSATPLWIWAGDVPRSPRDLPSEVPAGFTSAFEEVVEAERRKEMQEPRSVIFEATGPLDIAEPRRKSLKPVLAPPVYPDREVLAVLGRTSPQTAAELAAGTKLAINTVRRVLQDLIRSKRVLPNRVGNKIYYALEPGGPFSQPSPYTPTELQSPILPLPEEEGLEGEEEELEGEEGQSGGQEEVPSSEEQKVPPNPFASKYPAKWGASKSNRGRFVGLVGETLPARVMPPSAQALVTSIKMVCSSCGKSFWTSHPDAEYCPECSKKFELPPPVISAVQSPTRDAVLRVISDGRSHGSRDLSRLTGFSIDSVYKALRALRETGEVVESQPRHYSLSSARSQVQPVIDAGEGFASGGAGDPFAQPGPFGASEERVPKEAGTEGEAGGEESEQPDLVSTPSGKERVSVFVTKEVERRGTRPAFESPPQTYTHVCAYSKCQREFTASGAGARTQKFCCLEHRWAAEYEKKRDQRKASAGARDVSNSRGSLSAALKGKSPFEAAPGPFDSASGSEEVKKRRKQPEEGGQRLW